MFRNARSIQPLTPVTIATTQNQRTEAVVGLEMARARFDSGDYEEAIALARSTLSSLSRKQDRFKALHLIACSEGQKGWYKQSLRTLALVGELVDDLPAITRARFHGQRAFVHSKLKEVNEALIDLEAAKFWAEESGDAESIARARNNLSKQYSDAGRFDEALTEVNAAIEFALGHTDKVLLGQFYDMKAQILISRGQFSEALECSEAAMELQSGHPSAIEARETHGRALIGLGASYLTQDDPVATFRARRNALDLIPAALTNELIKLALEQSNGNVLNAASRLGIYHSALLKAMKNNGIPHKPRARSLVTK